MVEGIIFVFGLVIGSFLNVLIDRIPRGENIVWKPSHCDFCKKRLRWFELVPLISFAAFGGKCLRCKKRLSWQYPLSELVTAIGFVYIFYSGLSVDAIFVAMIFSIFLVLFGIDSKHQILPDGLLLCLLFIIIILGVWVSPSVRLIHVLSGVGAGGFFLLIWLMTKGKGLGFGDVKLALVLGLLLGHPFTIIALYIAFLTGAIVGVILMIGHRAGMKSRIAFGPFLILGAVSAYLWGERIWAMWNHLFL